MEWRIENEELVASKYFIRNSGAPYALRSDNTKMQRRNAIKKILRRYSIKLENIEPYHPNQNPAERKIQNIKGSSIKILVRTRVSSFLLFFYLLYTVMLQN